MEFDNEWLSLKPDGTVTVKGSHGRGYAWDGCSPKLKIRDVYVGTPEGVLNYGLGVSKTYYASLIHDVFYQFSRELRPKVKRCEADRLFYDLLLRDGFSFARLYYLAVRAFGWISWWRGTP
ncbi:MAG: DUF1353 domain-containing protein [Candidatus Omnitrophica bacterium]|nr:DUF1353 domain-containing protein [Candidatus Omnitrophota bacterium]